MQNRIVIADDDPTMRSALGEAMHSSGYEAAIFPDGAEAERHLRQYGADLVISDVRMPVLGGLELLKRFPNFPFIMISGFATVPEAVEAMKIGAYDFVVKPLFAPIPENPEKSQAQGQGGYQIGQVAQ